MTYKRPNIKYTTMAIYVDEHIYADEHRDDEKIYEYIYHLINMLAHQGGYFKNAQYYDDFALMGATRVFLRLINPKQFQLDENGKPQLEKIVSVLNYIKSILYPMKVEFEKENFKQISIYSDEEEQAENSSAIEIENNFQSHLEYTIDDIRMAEFDLYMHDVAKTARAFIEKIPHKKNDPEWTNIYLSCLLTFLNSITLNNRNKAQLKSLGKIIREKPQIVEKIYKEERKDSVILYHLDPGMRNYVAVLVNRLKHIISNDVMATTSLSIPSEINAKNLLMASLEEEDDEL